MPITGWAIIPVGPQQVGGIPPIAFSIPDFEGSTKVQIFANSSQTEIGCFQAEMRNGASLSHPEAIGPVLGVFTAVALIASFLTAAYGVSIVHMRMHYAHSLSVLVVFDAFQSIFLSGALSVAWPSVLVAWWSNFAWSAGQIPVPGLIRSMDSFAGVSGNASQVGGAGSVVINNGGGLASQIYGRLSVQEASAHLRKRVAFNASDPYDYTWAGHPVVPGLPMPGTWSGFSGSLSGVGIPVAHAFMVGFIWFLIALVFVAISVGLFKWALEFLASRKWVQQDRLAYFRAHWTNYTALAVLRTLFGGFFMISTLALYQFTLKGAVGTTAIAAVVFAAFFIALTALVVHACRARLKAGELSLQSDQILLYRDVFLKVLPCISLVRSSTLKEQELSTRPLATIPFFRIRHINNDPSRPTVHRDERYVKRFGWLSARYRRTRWWFFAFYMGYQLIRACFLGGAARSPLAQVYGLLILEIFAFLIIVHLNPFEGARNTALAVWMLGITKIATTGLSIAFLPELDLDRIVATVIGVVIVVIQGLLVIALLILVVLGAISTWLSLSRNREEFSPARMERFRIQYFEKMHEKASDNRQLPKPKTKKKDEEDAVKDMETSGEPQFSVTSVRRAPKIEDEDGDVITSLDSPRSNSALGADSRRVSRASRSPSLSPRHSAASLPRGSRPRRVSWSSKDLAEWDAQMERSNTLLVQGQSRNGSAALGNARPLDNRMSIASVIAQSVQKDEKDEKSAPAQPAPDARSLGPQSSHTSTSTSAANGSAKAPGSEELSSHHNNLPGAQ